MAGAAIEWATKVGIVKKASEMEAEARTVDDCGDVYFVPAFQGIFSPHWRDDARGLLIGMSLNTERGHLMRALLEAPPLQSKKQSFLSTSYSADAEHKAQHVRYSA